MRLRTDYFLSCESVQKQNTYVTLTWIIDMRVNTSLRKYELIGHRNCELRAANLEDVLEVLWLGMRLLQQSTQMNIQECWNVAQVKQTNVAKVNGFRK